MSLRISMIEWNMSFAVSSIICFILLLNKKNFLLINPLQIDSNHKYDFSNEKKNYWRNIQLHKHNPS